VYSTTTNRRSRLVRLAVVIVVLMLVAAGCTNGDATDKVDGCQRTTDPDKSVARVWDETLLDAIRRDFPSPTVHARNLFHLSAAMWDAWAAYDDQAVGYFVDEEREADDVAAAREEAMSYAAHAILAHRYLHAVGAEETRGELDATLEALCYPVELIDPDPDSPAAFGLSIAARIIEASRGDGSNEDLRYADPDYEPVNSPMVVKRRGTQMDDPNRWQPLALDDQLTQNEQELPSDVQEFVGSHWGHVTGFALPESPDGNPLDPGPPPYLGDPATDAEFKAAAVEVIRYSSLLDPAATKAIDAGPASSGNNPLGTYGGAGYDLNPAMGAPYEANPVPHADLGRVLAEFWADGPDSETPPGHWNVIANQVSDSIPELHLGGEGDPVGRLEWDVKLYLALNGALHDAAIAAWGAKGYYDYSRPISHIRYMGQLGQSSDPSGPSYHPDGLPLVDGLVEVVTAESAYPRERHEHLSTNVGEVVIRAWAGNPDDPETETGGVEWIRAVEWVPYQRPTFVTPAFAGYVSGHSTFSRAAAEVLTAATGDPFFPGGLDEWAIPAGSLGHEAGPSEPLTLQWATYYDAADQAGISRLYGGIHVRADDLAGRVMGATCGQEAWELAQRYFDGSAAA
jgi:hypothetical protein